MSSRPGAQHQSAECSIASCVVLIAFLPVTVSEVWVNAMCGRGTQ